MVLSCVVLSFGQRGGGVRGGGAPPAQNRGGARGGPAGRGRGQQQQRRDDLDPNNGMVMAFITVTGKDHRAFPGLTKNNFKVTEDNAEQTIELFNVENGPLSVGFVLGATPSESRGVPLEFLKATTWMNEFFLINDDGHPPGGTVIQSFTTDPLKATTIYPQGGVSADSIFMGLDYLKEAANRRKVMVLIGSTLTGDAATPTGGGLDPFRVERQATRQDVQVYSIIAVPFGEGAIDDGGTSDIAPLTGGRSYLAADFSAAMESTAREIAHGLAVQYEIGYRSTNPTPDGKWRGIKVSLVNLPENAGKLDVSTKSGYYVDKEKKSK
ncbi:MAG TPA: hypothetical protein VK210_15375 [Terriglobia bacterium]|nr:hypothetical protein [Terriglobia bacterium]